MESTQLFLSGEIVMTDTEIVNIINKLGKRVVTLEDGALVRDEQKGKFIISVDNYGMEFKLCEVKYVHQLQNLYFALTGKELELTNNTN